MSPVDIDPNTGAPVVKDDGVQSLPPVSPANTTSEPTTATDEEVAKILEEVPSYPKSREEYLKLMKDIVRRYTSDTQSYEKCVAELSALIPE